MATISTLKDSSDNILYPQTLVKAIYDEDGNRLDNIVLLTDNTIAYTPTGDYNPATKKYVDDSGIGIVVSSTQPTTQSTGDFWYQII